MTARPASRDRAASPPPRILGDSPAENLNKWVGDPSFMLTLARGLLVVRVLTDAGGKAVSVSELVAATGLPRATIRRCLYSLEATGYARMVGKGFALGPEFVALVSSYVASSPVLAAYEPVIRDLADETKLSVAFGLYEGWRGIYVNRVVSQTRVTIGVDVRAELPLYCTSVGRVLLASKTDPEVEAYLKSETLVARTDKTVLDPDKLMEIVRRTRQSGYCLVDGEAEPELRSITVPIRDGAGRSIAWINIGAHTALTTLRQIKLELIPAMLRAGAEISKRVP